MLRNTAAVVSVLSAAARRRREWWERAVAPGYWSGGQWAASRARLLTSLMASDLLPNVHCARYVMNATDTKGQFLALCTQCKKRKV